MHPTRLRAHAPACALVLALSLLAGCASPGRDAFPPVCPVAEVLPGAGNLAMYRPGGGHDLRDVQIEGTVLGASGACKDGAKHGTVDATLTVRIRFQRGPAAPTRQANIPYFVAVAQGNRILDKTVRVATVVFPMNVDTATITTEPVNMTFPVGPDRSAAGYQIWVGFQRTTAQPGAR